MSIGVLGKKIGMTRVFAPDGTAVAVTLIEAAPNPVLQLKESAGKDGYTAVQLGGDPISERKVNKPMKGHMAKAGKGFYRTVREFRLESLEGYELGKDVTVEIFAPGEKVKVTATSKGKGFQGVMRRHNFRGLPDSHGAEKVHRSPGSIGNATFPGKVIKGKKMPGQMGNERVTALNVEVLDVRPENNLVVLKGAVPGPKGGLVMIRKK